MCNRCGPAVTVGDVSSSAFGCLLLKKVSSQLEMADVVVNAGLEQMVTKGEFNEFKADTKKEFTELREEINARFDKMQVEFNTRFDSLFIMIKSQQTKTELGGEIVPSPAEGVVDENQIILVNNAALFKRFKGRVLILRRVAAVPRKKRWKYE